MAHMRDLLLRAAKVFDPARGVPVDHHAMAASVPLMDALLGGAIPERFISATAELLQLTESDEILDAITGVASGVVPPVESAMLDPFIGRHLPYLEYLESGEVQYHHFGTIVEEHRRQRSMQISIDDPFSLDSDSLEGYDSDVSESTTVPMDMPGLNDLPASLSQAIERNPYMPRVNPTPATVAAAHEEVHGRLPVSPTY